MLVTNQQGVHTPQQVIHSRDIGLTGVRPRARTNSEGQTASRSLGEGERDQNTYFLGQGLPLLTAGLANLRFTTKTEPQIRIQKQTHHRKPIAAAAAQTKQRRR